MLSGDGCRIGPASIRSIRRLPSVCHRNKCMSSLCSQGKENPNWIWIHISIGWRWDLNFFIFDYHWLCSYGQCSYLMYLNILPYKVFSLLVKSTFSFLLMTQQHCSNTICFRYSGTAELKQGGVLVVPHPTVKVSLAHALTGQTSGAPTGLDHVSVTLKEGWSVNVNQVNLHHVSVL